MSKKFSIKLTTYFSFENHGDQKAGKHILSAESKICQPKNSILSKIIIPIWRKQDIPRLEKNKNKS